MFRRRHVRMLPLCVFFVLAWAATASAQCAWVLWERRAESSLNWSPWSPHHLLPDQERMLGHNHECDGSTARRIATRSHALGARNRGLSSPESTATDCQWGHCILGRRSLFFCLPLPPRHRGPARAEGEVIRCCS
jgi:hypothetical protein